MRRISQLLKRLYSLVLARSKKPRARLTRRGRAARIVLAVIAAPFVIVTVMAIFTPLPAELREPTAPSLRVVANNGQLLREVRTDDGARSRPLPLNRFPKQTRDAVLAAEDRHFYYHPGFDPVAIVRAAVSDILHRRIVSGASTITMQLARTLRPHKRSTWGKFTEIALAIRIEASLSKDQILEEYLNRVIYGPNLRGYAAASQAYFGAPPESISLAEAALIAGLPRGPSLYDVTKRPNLARRRRDRVLARMADTGMIDQAACDQATAEPIATTTIDKPLFGAPHLVRGLVLGTKEVLNAQPSLLEALADRTSLSEIQTTIDPELQRAAENAVTISLASLTAQGGKHVTAASVVIVDNATGDVLAYVGSPDFYGTSALGQNDGVIALRQPGSSLKPFVYAEAMSHLGYTGATLLPDVEIHIPIPGGGDYVPHDYDAKLRGPVRLREALGNSLNIPAVYTIHELGTQRVLDRLHAMGFHSLTEDAEHYGPALALGDGEVTLLELANAYATLARDGILKPLRLVKGLKRGDANPIEIGDSSSSSQQSVLEPRIARMLTDILSDKNARMSAFGDQNVLEFDFDVAAKTGTSKGYRDNVAVGFTRDITVATWAGNFDGSSMGEVSGITGAGPIFHSVMEVAAERVTVQHGSRAGGTDRLSLTAEEAHVVGLARVAVCELSGDIPTSACPHRVFEWLPEGASDHAPACAVHARTVIDIRNGLRAGPGCAAGVTEARVFERWHAPYDGWAQRTNRPIFPRGGSTECPLENNDDNGLATDTDDHAGLGGNADEVQITYPFDGSRFVIDPERPISLQSLDIRVEPNEDATEVRVDGALLTKKRTWILAEGTHTITAMRKGHASQPVKFSVR